MAFGSDERRCFPVAGAVNQPVEFGILHVTEDPTGIVELAVVQIGQGGQSLGIAMGGAGHERAVPGES